MHQLRCSIKQVFSVVPATTCKPFMTLEAARQKLRVSRGEADLNVGKSSGTPSSPIAGKNIYGIDIFNDGDLNEGQWGLNDVASTSGETAAACSPEARASFMKHKRLGAWPHCVCQTLF